MRSPKDLRKNEFGHHRALKILSQEERVFSKDAESAVCAETLLSNTPRGIVEGAKKTKAQVRK